MVLTEKAVDIKMAPVYEYKGMGEHFKHDIHYHNSVDFVKGLSGIRKKHSLHLMTVLNAPVAVKLFHLFY